jgi:Ca2+-binding RTX toxin-like protein
MVGGLGALPSLAPSASLPRCLGRTATIVGSGEVHGTARADVIVNGPGADRILGGGGNDRICSGGGGDWIEGGSGSDRISAGGGDDSVIGGNGSDLVLGDGGRDTLIGNRGNDRLFGQAGDRDFLDSGLGDDTVSGGGGSFDQVIGGVGNDRLFGGAGDGDLLRAGLGSDLIDGGPGGHDVVSYALAGEGNAFIGGLGVQVDLANGSAGGDGTDSLHGIEDVVGTPFADTISGSSGPNALYGGGGDDYIHGIGGGDVAHGGAGFDRCLDVAAEDSCEPSPSPEISKESILEVDLAGGPVATTLTAVVRTPYALYGKPGISLVVSFVEGAWLLRESGIPIAVGDGCEEVGLEEARCPVSGTPDAVFVAGSGGADRLEIDSSVPPTVGAAITGDLGTDLIIGGAGDDSLDGGAGEPSYAGDVLEGRGGDDILATGGRLEGGSGSDLLIAQPCAGETILGGDGVDSVSFARVEAAVEAELGGTAGFIPPSHPVTPFSHGCPDRPEVVPTRILPSVENIEGSPQGDVLRGNGHRNMLLGRGGDDGLYGGAGNDFLVGGTGRDSIAGEQGADRLYARDRQRDKALSCRPGGRGDVAATDSGDPFAAGCRLLK